METIMSEPTTEPTEAVETETPDEPLGKAGLKALQEERDAHKRAKDHAKQLQEQLDALNAEKLSDLEKAQQAAAQSAQEAADARREALRYRLAAKHGISEEDAALFLTADSEDAMQAQAERLAARTATQEPGNPKPDLTQGGSKTPPALNSDELTDALKAAVGA